MIRSLAIAAALILVGCSSGGEESVGDVSLCSCVNDPPTSGARVNACAEIMNSMTPEAVAGETLACRASMPVPEDGPDLCYCARSMSQDPAIIEACNALLPDDMSAREATEIVAQCMQ